jgi:hypothetical protein
LPFKNKSLNLKLFVPKEYKLFTLGKIFPDAVIDPVIFKDPVMVVLLRAISPFLAINSFGISLSFLYPGFEYKYYNVYLFT